MKLVEYKLGDLITQRREKNKGYNVPICGVTKTGFIPPKQKIADTSLYNVFYMHDFVFNPARMELNSIVFNNLYEKAICSSLYEVFYVSRPDIILPEYLGLMVKRNVFTRYCEFIGNGSVREYCRVANISEMKFTFPENIDEQRRRVKAYQVAVNRLNIKATISKKLDEVTALNFDRVVQKLQKSEYIPLADVIERTDKRNRDGKVTKLLGITLDKHFINSVANTSETDLTNYKVIENNIFACNLMHVGRDKKIPLARYTLDVPSIISPAYPMFYVKDTSRILSEFLDLWFKRDEFDRVVAFLSISGIRGNMTWEDFVRLPIPIPNISLQKEVVDMHLLNKKRKDVSNGTKELDELKNLLLSRLATE